MTDVSRNPKPRNVGRSIALGVYWALALYMVAVGFYSVTPQVFWPRSTAADIAETPDNCREAIRGLFHELHRRAGTYVAKGGTWGRGLSDQPWWPHWDARYLAAGPICEETDPDPYTNLGRLRHRVEIQLRQVDRRQARLSHEINEALDAPPLPPRTR